MQENQLGDYKHNVGLRYSNGQHQDEKCGMAPGFRLQSSQKQMCGYWQKRRTEDECLVGLTTQGVGNDEKKPSDTIDLDGVKET